MTIRATNGANYKWFQETLDPELCKNRESDNPLDQNLADASAVPAAGNVADLLRQLQTLRADTFVTESFDPKAVRIDNTDRPWRYRLEADITLASGVASSSTTTTTTIDMATVDDLAQRMLTYLISAGLLPEKPTAEQRELLQVAVPLVQERMETLTQGAQMLGFLFAADAGIETPVTGGVRSFSIVEREMVQLHTETNAALSAAADVLADTADWTAAEIEAALRSALIDKLGLKPKLAFGPVRIATAGRRVSPPLFESLELLGRERTLARIRAAIVD